MTLLAAIEQVVEATEGSGLSEELEQSFCSVALFGIMRTIERVAIFCFLLNVRRCIKEKFPHGWGAHPHGNSPYVI